jgi:hypothetical protein
MGPSRRRRSDNYCCVTRCSVPKYDVESPRADNDGGLEWVDTGLTGCAATWTAAGSTDLRQKLPPLERPRCRSTAIAVNRKTAPVSSCQECDQLRLGVPGLCLGVPGKGNAFMFERRACRSLTSINSGPGAPSRLVLPTRSLKSFRRESLHRRSNAVAVDLRFRIAARPPLG